MFIAVRTGLEPATPGVTGPYSNQLNYRTSISIMLPFSGKADAKVCIIFELYNNTSTFFKKINCVFTFRPPVSIQTVDLHHLWYSRAESNRNRRNRNPKFYPLNYGSNRGAKIIIFFKAT